MSDIASTTAAYDRIAADYAARWGLADVMAATRRRFAALLPPQACVLDAGCGPAHDTAGLRGLGLRAVGLDRSRGMLAQRLADLPVMLGDMVGLPVRDHVLDGVWASASFLHIPKRAAPDVLAEFRRALRPGGILYIGVKQGDGERWIEHPAGARRFFAFYQPPELDKLLVTAGFRVREAWVDADTLGREPWLGRFMEP
jgi:SAM-dependent methyltransferase